MKIKICGLTDPKEAQYLNQNHADFAGMVLFFPKSKRNITPTQAAAIIAALSDTIKKVAVVVSPTEAEIRQIEALPFDYIQIHGKLSSDLLHTIHLPILKAFNVSDMDQYEFYHNCPQIAGYVFDAQEPGSGKVFDWSLVDRIPRDEKLFLLAGGLTAENVAEAIRRLHPDGVDVSSAVEFTDKPGKDPEKIQCFIEKARASHLT